MHPVDIAAQRVDLAVVRHVAIRMGAFPAWKGVGAEPRVDQCERRLHRRIPQVGKILRQLLGQEHTLVDDGLVGQARQIPILAAVESRRADLVVGALADHVELALKRQIVAQALAAANEDLPDEWFARPGGVTQRRTVGRHRAPTEETLSFRLHNLLKPLLQPPAVGGIAGQEDQPAAVLGGAGQDDPRLLARLGEKGVGNLEQHARPVAGVGFAAAGAAVVEILQHLDRLLQDLVRPVALDIHHETHAAGVVFEPGIVKALLGRQSNPPGPEVGGAVASVVHFSDAAWILRSGCRQPESLEQVGCLIPAALRRPGMLSGENGMD